MPDTWYFLLTSALSLLAMAAGFVDGRRDRQRVQMLAVGFVVLLVAKAALSARPDWEATLFPWADYAYFQGYWIWPLALYFFALVAGQCGAGWNRRLVAAVAGVVFAASLWSQRWMVVGLPDTSTATADAQHQCVQTDGHTCVPASCVALLSYWDIPATEGEMVHLCLTRGGTSLFNAYRGLRLKARDRGLRVRVLDLDLDEVLSLGVPVLFGDGSHARVLVVTGGLCLVHDPAMPEPEVWPRERVAATLHGPVVAIESIAGAQPSPPPALALARAHRDLALMHATMR